MLMRLHQHFGIKNMRFPLIRFYFLKTPSHQIGIHSIQIKSLFCRHNMDQLGNKSVLIGFYAVYTLMLIGFNLLKAVEFD